MWLSKNCIGFMFNILDLSVVVPQIYVCHRDLKSKNLLSDENGILKVSDFGLSELAMKGGLRRLLCILVFFCYAEG